MKVYGNYYKNTDRGKKKQSFEMEVTDGNLCEMRAEASKKLREKDIDFRGMRELFTADNTKKEESTPNSFVFKNSKEEPELITKKITETDIREEAKSMGIRNWHNKKIDNLIKELNDLDINK